MEQFFYIFFTFGYVLTFGILGAMVFLLHVPKDAGMEQYKKARLSLGTALVALSLYCIIRLIIPQSHTEYLDFWILVTFTLIHSWLTYTTLLYLLEIPRFLTKHFIIDGVMPICLLIISGFAGLAYPSTRGWMQIVFGVIFGLKCAYMFYICLREYKKCQNDIDNYYDESPDISWIKGIIYLSLFMSAATIVAFYVHSIHLLYYLSIPVIYAYIVFKVINFAPKKIDAIRKRNNTMDSPVAEKKKVTDLGEKIGHKVDSWVASERFCTPELNIKDVASEIGTNHNYLSQYLNNSLNMTFQVWLNTLRIEKSKQFLTDGSKTSIEEVGQMVGFTQIYNFSRWFRTVTGTTPLRYRKNNGI